MKAALIRANGGPGVVRVEEVPPPRPDAGEASWTGTCLNTYRESRCTGPRFPV